MEETMAPMSVSRRLAALGSAVLVVALLAGCATPASAPGKETIAGSAVAPTGAATMAAATTAQSAPPAGTGSASTIAVATPEGPSDADAKALIAEEALANAEERVQALDMRLTDLAQLKGPNRDVAVQAVTADLRNMLDQLDIVVGSLEQGEAVARAKRLARTITVVAGLSKMVDRFAALPEGASQAAALRAGVAALSQRVDAAATAAPPAPALTATP
jgi:hypothetical protein